MTNPFRVAGIVLAAGGSSRLGHPKQLVEYQGQTLVARVIQQLHQAGCGSVTTVLGAFESEIRPAIRHASTAILVNKSWENGMGTSLRLAVKQTQNLANAVLIALCDQPLIATAHYRNLVDAISRTDHPIVATGYPEESIGVPAAFLRSEFESLLALDDEEGAKRIIEGSEHHRIELTGLANDLDTAKDLEDIMNLRNP